MDLEGFEGLYGMVVEWSSKSWQTWIVSFDISIFLSSLALLNINKHDLFHHYTMFITYYTLLLPFYTVDEMVMVNLGNSRTQTSNLLDSLSLLQL